MEEGGQRKVVYLIRHGQSQFNAADWDGYHDDVTLRDCDLTAKGIKQAKVPALSNEGQELIHIPPTYFTNTTVGTTGGVEWEGIEGQCGLDSSIPITESHSDMPSLRGASPHHFQNINNTPLHRTIRYHSISPLYKRMLQPQRVIGVHVLQISIKSLKAIQFHLQRICQQIIGGTTLQLSKRSFHRTLIGQNSRNFVTMGSLSRKMNSGGGLTNSRNGCCKEKRGP